MPTTTYPDGSQLVSTALNPIGIETAFQIITAQMLGILTSPQSFTITLIEGQFTGVVNSTTNLYTGQLVTATGVPANTLISGINGTTISLSNANTANGTNVVASVTDPQYPYKVRIAWQEQGQPGPPGPQTGLDTVIIRCIPHDADYGRMRDVVYASGQTTFTATDVFTRGWKVTWTFYGPNSTDNARAVRSALDTIQFVADYLAGYNLYVNPSIKEPERVPELFQGNWWERVILEATFNEQITETYTVGLVESVEVKIYNEAGQIADFTVTTP